MLHNDNKLFIDTVLATSEYFSISPHLYRERLLDYSCASPDGTKR